MTQFARVLFPAVKERKEEIPADYLRVWISERELEFGGIRSVPGNKNALISEIKQAVKDCVALTIICGGTGLGQGNIVPQSLAAVTEYEVVGIGEFMRAQGAAETTKAWIGRGGCWVKGESLFLSVSGGSNALQQQLGYVASLMTDVLRAMRGDCGSRT